MVRPLPILALPALLAGCLFGGGKEPPPPGPVTQMNVEGVRRLEKGDPHGAEEMFEHALASAELTDDIAGEAEAWNNLGALARERGAPAEALGLHRRALALHRLAGSWDGEARTRNNLGAALLALGRVKEARAEFDAAAALYAAHDDRAGTARARVGVAAVLLREGKDLRGALAAAREAKAAAGDGDDKATLAAALANEAGALVLLGDLSGARGAGEAALGLDKAREAPAATAGDLRLLGQVHEKQKDAPGAAGLYARAARVERRLGDLDGCERDLGRAIALAREARLADEAGECQAELDALRAERAKEKAAARPPAGASVPTSK
jgi:tetratricopeptide (TPR) repeat protein